MILNVTRFGSERDCCNCCSVDDDEDGDGDDDGDGNELFEPLLNSSPSSLLEPLLLLLLPLLLLE